MRIFNCQFDPVTYNQTLEWARERFRSKKRGYIATVNVSILMTMRSNPELRQFIDEASLTVVDGQPIVWLSKLLGKPLPERVAGVDLVSGLCQSASDCGQSVFFLGSKPDVVAETARRIKNSIPNLQIAGSRDGYFSKEKSCEVAASIRDSGAGLLILGLGVPLQEQFLQEHWDDLGITLAIPIGGAFDMISDRKPRAAKWIQSLGMEWLWRLYLEPRRLAKRYLITNTKFLALSFISVVFTRPLELMLR